jgi:hypothetical protein
MSLMWYLLATFWGRRSDPTRNWPKTDEPWPHFDLALQRGSAAFSRDGFNSRASSNRIPLPCQSLYFPEGSACPRLNQRSRF